jgi:hypothetical protein
MRDLDGVVSVFYLRLHSQNGRQSLSCCPVGLQFVSRLVSWHRRQQ